MVFPIVMYGCESWTIKKAECQRFDAFELWCWKRLLRVPWSARRSNQSIVKEINPGYSLKGLMLKLKLQYFGYMMWRPDSLERLMLKLKLQYFAPDAKSWLIGKDPDAGKDWRQEKKGTTEDEVVGWHHQLNGHEFEQTLEIVKDREAWCSAVHKVPKSQTWLSDWTAISILGHFIFTHGHWNVSVRYWNVSRLTRTFLIFDSKDTFCIFFLV